MYFFIFFEDAVLKYFWFRFQAQNLKFRVWSENFSGDNGDGKLDENEYLLDMTDPSNPGTENRGCRTASEQEHSH